MRQGVVARGIWVFCDSDNGPRTSGRSVGPFEGSGSHGNRHVRTRLHRERADRVEAEMLRRALQGHDRQMLPTREVADVQVEPSTGAASYPGVRDGARRIRGPQRAGFEARLKAGGVRAVVDLVGCRREQPGMRPVLVVTGGEQRKFVQHRTGREGNDHESRALALDRLDQPLDHHDAAVLAGG